MTARLGQMCCGQAMLKVRPLAGFGSATDHTFVQIGLGHRADGGLIGEVRHADGRLFCNFEGEQLEAVVLAFNLLGQALSQCCAERSHEKTAAAGVLS